MSPKKNSEHTALEYFIGYALRLVIAVLLGGLTYFLLSFWNTLDLSHEMKIGVSVIVGIIFFIVGGNIYKWIDEISFWS